MMRVYNYSISNQSSDKTMKKIVSKKSKGAPISDRIDSFIEKLKNTNQSDTETIRIYARNELRWLGVESDNPRYGLNTIKSYLTEYKNRIALELPFHSEFETKIGKLAQKYDKKIESVTKAKNPQEAMNAVGQIKAEIVKSCRVDPLVDDLKKLKIAHKAYYNLHLKGSQKLAIKSSASKAVADKKDNRTRISKKVVDDVIKNNLANYNPKKIGKYKLLAALVLATGRRPVEIALTGKLTKTDKGKIMFTGQAKKKHGELAIAYEIPLLGASFEQVQKGVNAFRKSFKNSPFKSERDVNKKMSTDVTRQVRELLKNHDVTMYDCRAIYANIMAENQTADRDRYMARILGHGERDTATVNSYQGIELTELSVSEAEAEYRATSTPKERITAVGKESSKGTVSREAKAMAKKIQSKQKKAEELGRAVGKINQWAADYLLAGGQLEFTQTMITKEGGFSRPAIKKWLESCH